MINTIEPTNADKSQQLAQTAQARLLKDAGRDWLKAYAVAVQAGKLELKALNLARLAGIKLQEASGHEQASFEFFRRHQGDLPKIMSFHAVKFCVRLAKSFSEPIRTMDEARSARQMMFEAFGESTAPKRVEAQTGHESNPWNDFVSWASTGQTLFGKLEADAMERWDVPRLQTFIRETQPVVDAHARAKAIAGK